jgi:hypothetical protein
MRRRGTALLAFLFFCGILCGQPPQDRAQRNTIIAVIRNVNVMEKQITVLDTWSRAAQFTLGDASRVTGPNGELRTIGDLKVGYQVAITYDATEGVPNDVTVTILPGQE